MINKIPKIVCLIFCVSFCHFIAPLYSNNLDNKLPHIEEYQLDNGMRVLISHNYDNPVVYVNVNIDAGRLDDPENRPNLSQKAFYNIGQGTSKFPSIDHIRDKLFSVGSDDGSFKRFHITNFYGEIEDYFLKKDLNEGLELISEVLIHPTYPIFFKNFLKSLVFRFSPKTSLIKNRNLIRSHGLHQYANVYSHIHPKVSSKYGKKNLRKWHDNHFRPENTTIMIVGDVNSIYVKKMINKYFSGWMTTDNILEKRQYPISLTDKSGIKLRFIHVEDNKDALISIMQRAPSINDGWIHAGILAHSAFGDRGFSSRLSKIHSKFNFYGYLNSNLMRYPRLPYVEIMGEVQYEELSRLYYEIRAEFKNLSNNSITQIELDRLKTIRLNDYNNSLYDPERFSNFIQDNYNFNGYSLEKISNKWAQINRVTLEEINNAASKIFDADNLMMVVVGNKDSCSTFLEQFENVDYYEHTEELRESASKP